MMNIHNLFCRNAAAIVILAACSPTGFAADKAADQTKRLQQQMRTLERDKSQLTAKKAELESQLKEAQDGLAGAKRRGDAATRRGAELSKAIEKLNGEKDALQARLSELEQSLEAEQAKRADTEKRLAEAVRQGEAQVNALQVERKQLEAALAASRERNERMFKLGYELIERYERVAVSQAEPITGIGRARIEKMAEEDRDKFDKDRLPPIQIKSPPENSAAERPGK